MRPGPPLADLPDAVTFTLKEVADLLFLVDLVVESAEAGTPEHAEARRAQRLITVRLWPELGDLLDDDEEEVE